MFNTEAAEADYTLAKLYEVGPDALSADIQSLQEGEEADVRPKPKDTYEVAEGVIGVMPYPKLGIRETMAEITEEVEMTLFSEDASSEDFQRLNSEDEEESGKAAENAIKEGVTVEQFQNQMNRAACMKAVAILDFDGEKPDPKDVNPEMASLVVNHFLALRPSTKNGHSRS